MMSDYRLQIKVKNAKLARKIEDAGFDSVAAFCRSVNLTQTAVGNCLNLKTSVYCKNFTVRKTPKTIADYFMCEPEDLFPEEVWYDSISKNEFFKDVSSSQVLNLTAQAKSIPALENMIDMENLVDELLNHVTEREKGILLMRFDDGMTLDEVGVVEGVTGKRVRDIQNKALRKLRNPKNNNAAMEFFNNGGLV